MPQLPDASQRPTEVNTPKTFSIVVSRKVMNGRPIYDGTLLDGDDKPIAISHEHPSVSNLVNALGLTIGRQAAASWGADPEPAAASNFFQER